jgi:hypothetical protein
MVCPAAGLDEKLQSCVIVRVVSRLVTGRSARRHLAMRGVARFGFAPCTQAVTSGLN